MSVRISNSMIVGIGVIVVPAAKNSTSLNHPKDILYDENYLYGIELIHLTSRKHFQTAVGPLHFVVPFIISIFFIMQRNHTNVLIFPSNTFLEQHI